MTQEREQALKTSELIEILQKSVVEHGDLPIGTYNSWLTAQYVRALQDVDGTLCLEIGEYS